jgi:DNA-binding response OmpR family regulator
MTDSEQRVVLGADDEKDVRQLVAYRLRAAGYEVVEAQDGEEAVRLAEERPPDLVVLDVMMPKLDGYEVARRLRRNDATSEAGVIMLTSMAASGDVERGLDVGADEYIRKPFTADELLACVEGLLGR